MGKLRHRERQTVAAAHTAVLPAIIRLKFFGFTQAAETMPARAKARLEMVSVRLTAAVSAPSSRAMGIKNSPPVLSRIPTDEAIRPHMAASVIRYLPRVCFRVCMLCLLIHAEGCLLHPDFFRRPAFLILPPVEYSRLRGV